MPTARDYYGNPYQYSMEDYTTATPDGDVQAVSYNPGYLQDLLALRHKIMTGQATAWDREWYAMQEHAAMAVPMRDVGTLTYNAGEEAPERLSGGSPDLARIMLTLAGKLEQGTATPQERALFQTTYTQLADQNYRASVPQASDANPFGLGDNLVGALSILGLGAGAGAALAPLAAGSALTLGSAAGLAGTAGTFTGMMGQALDEDWLRKAGIAMGAAGGLAGAGSLLTQGLTSVGDVAKLLQKTYGAGSKIYGLSQDARSSPDRAGLPRGPNDPNILYSMDPAARPDRVSSRAQALTAEDSARGEGMDTDWTQIGALLSGAVGLAGAGLSLADVARYMGQLKDQYGERQEIKTLIDQAYELAKQRYETYYQQTQRQNTQAQEAYRTAVDRADTYYNQTQEERAQRQQAYEEQRGQIAEDRQTQQQSYFEDRQKVNATFDQRQQALLTELNEQRAIYGDNRARQITNFDARQQELQQNRQKELQTFDQDYQRKLQTDTRQQAEIDQERGMGMRGWEASYNIGATLSDPTKIKEGAQQIYRPLSDLAVQRVSDEVSVDRSLRGLTGPGPYGDYLAAKAYAPFENQLWTTALNTYLTGQRSAIDAYGNRTLARTNDYEMTQVPRFTTGEQWAYMDVPNYTDLAQFTYGQRPVFEQQNATNVPQTTRYDPRQAPGVPTAISPENPPRVPEYTATPYAPFGTTRETGQGTIGGVGSGLQTLIGNLTKLLGQGNTGPGSTFDATSPAGLAKMVTGLQSLLNMDPSKKAAIQAELDQAMKNNDLYGFGTRTPFTPDYSYDYGGTDYGLPGYTGTDFADMPYDNWSYEAPDFQMW